MDEDVAQGHVLTVFLVHGTYARGAPWARPESQLASAIASAYPRVRIVSFNWSGDNSHRARMAAGRKLASRIRQAATDAPTSKIAIVAHSHGGNVALYALRDKAVAALVSDIVFLGTPFFRFNRLDVRPAVRLFARIVGILTFAAAMCLGAFAMLGYGPDVLSWEPDIELTTWTAPIIVALTTLIVVSPIFFLLVLPHGIAVLIERWFGLAILSLLLRRRAALFRWLATPALPVRGMVFRSPRDEAFLYLSGLALITSSPFFIWSVIVACTRSIPLIAALLLLAQCMGNDFVPETEAFVSINSFYAAAVGIACLYPAAIVSTLLMISLPALTRGNSYAFGWVGFLGSALLDVQPMAVPEATPGVPVSLVVRTGQRNRPMSLIHSSYYSDPSVLRDIVSFLRGSNVGQELPKGYYLRRRAPVFRWIAVSAAVVVSASAMLRYDYVQQQRVVWEEGARTQAQAEWRDIFRAERATLRIDPQQSHMLKFDLGSVLPQETCRLVGYYRSDGSRIEVMVQIERPSEKHDSDGLMEYYWDKFRPKPDEKVMRELVSAFLRADPETQQKIALGAIEDKFTRSWIHFSGDYRNRKEVHFNRILSDAELGGTGGILLHNRGTTSAINVDYVFAIICHRP